MKKILYIVLIIFIFCILVFYIIAFNNSFNSKKEYILFNKVGDKALNQYIFSVLACEMPASYNEEALKAQVVAVRTFALFENDYTNSKEQCRITESELKTKWGNNYQKYYNKLNNIVINTNDIITKENELFKTFYFSTSNGHTLNSKDVFNEGNILGVESIFDVNSKDYKKEIVFNKTDLVNKLGNFNTLKVLKRDETNHVLVIKVDDKELSGIKFRKLLDLRSTDFEINKNNDVYTITTYGYGHGVGMSQYGANYLANKGYDYKYILKYYYGDINFLNYV